MYRRGYRLVLEDNFMYEDVELDVIDENDVAEDDVNGNVNDDDNGDFNSDEEQIEVDFDPNADQIEPEYEAAIDERLQHVGLGGNTTEAFISDISLSMDLNAVDAQSTVVLDEITISSNDASLPSVEQQPSTSTAPQQPSTSASQYLKQFAAQNARSSVPANSNKRYRSPLPSFEATGPAIVPNDGGFKGTGMYA